MPNPHNWLTALDPPGNYDRRWRCNYCDEEGLFGELMGPEASECSFDYPPCEHCGQTPECAPDCMGAWSALKGVMN